MCDESYCDIIIEDPQPVLMLYILQPSLVQACFHRNPDEVRSLLQQKAEVNFQVIAPFLFYFIFYLSSLWLMILTLISIFFLIFFSTSIVFSVILRPSTFWKFFFF